MIEDLQKAQATSLSKEAAPRKRRAIYWCICCEKWHDVDTPLGNRHIAYVPIFGGIYVDRT